MNFQIFISFYIFVKFTVTIMADKICNKNIVENSPEVSLKTTTESDGSTIRMFLKNADVFKKS